MARLGISYVEVAEAANTIVQQHQNPTIEKVRIALGNTGSLATISKYLNQWRAQHFENQANALATPVIPANEVNHVIANAWEQLNTQAQQQVEKIKQESDEKVAVALQEKAAAEQQRDETLNSLEKANKKVNHLETDLILLKKELTEMRHIQARAEERAAEHEKMLNVLQSESKTYVQALEKIHAESQQGLKQQLTALQQHSEKERSDWKGMVENQRTAFMVELDQLKTAKENVEKLNAKLTVELEQQSQRYKELIERSRGLEADLTITRERQQTAEKRAIAIKAENEHQNRTISFLNKTLDKLIKKTKAEDEALRKKPTDC